MEVAAEHLTTFLILTKVDLEVQAVAVVLVHLAQQVQQLKHLEQDTQVTVTQVVKGDLPHQIQVEAEAVAPAHKAVTSLVQEAETVVKEDNLTSQAQLFTMQVAEVVETSKTIQGHLADKVAAEEETKVVKVISHLTLQVLLEQQILEVAEVVLLMVKVLINLLVSAVLVVLELLLSVTRQISVKS